MSINPRLPGQPDNTTIITVERVGDLIVVTQRPGGTIQLRREDAAELVRNLHVVVHQMPDQLDLLLGLSVAEPRRGGAG